MVLKVTKIEVEGKTLKLSSGNALLALLPMQGISVKADPVNPDLVDISDSAGRLVPFAYTQVVDWRNLTEPIAASRADLMGYLEQAVAVAQGTTDVAIQDQSTDIVNAYLGERRAELTVLVNTVKDAETVTLGSPVAPLVGNAVCLQEAGKITQVLVTSVADNGGGSYTVGISEPLDYAYTTAGGCYLLDIDLNKDGSLAPIDYYLTPKADAKWHILRITIIMILDSAGDDGLFGNLQPLQKGVYVRKEDAESSQALFNLIENADIRAEASTAEYTTRSSGTGSYGFCGQILFVSPEGSGVVIELDGARGESLRAQVRDNLTGLVRFRIKAHGHVVKD